MSAEKKNKPDLASFANENAVIQELATLSRAKTKLQTEKKIQQAQIKELEEALEEAQLSATIHGYLGGHNYEPPKWLKKKGKKGSGVVCTILSDTHFDEIVRPEEIQHRNEYNRKIAVKRLETYFQKIILLTTDYITGIEYEGCVLFLGGDLFSGDIHEELSETNEDTILSSVIFWTEQLAAGINLLADHFNYVHVPSVVGNHGRRTRKSRAKLRAKDNFDWLLSKTLEKQFEDHERVTFNVGEAADTFVQVQDTTYLLTHGDQARGGGGIGGIWPPLMRMVARKRQNAHFDYMVLGHFHQLIMAPSSGFMLNGSLKGYDEYAAISNYPYEAPQQALWIDTPDKNVLWQTAITFED